MILPPIPQCRTYERRFSHPDKRRVKLLRFEFMNDALYSQDPLAGYGAANLVKSKVARKKYDSSQMLQTLQDFRALAIERVGYDSNQSIARPYIYTCT